MTQAQTFDALAFVKAKRAAQTTGFDALEFVKRKRAERSAVPTNTIPEDGSGFTGEATKGAARATANIAAGAAAGGPSVIQYLGEAVAGANALPMQILSAGANAIGMPALGDAYQRTAEAVASKGIDISRAVGRGVANAPIMAAGGATLPQMAQVPRALAQSAMIKASDRAAADLAQMNNGTNFLPQTGAGWGSLTGEQLPALGAGFAAGLVGGPTVGVAVTGAMAGAQEYEATLAQLMREFPGKSADFYEGEAARRAIQSAAVESVTERLPMSEILEGKLAKMFIGKTMNQWPRWARVLMGQTAKAATSALSEGTEEVVSEGAGAVGDRLAGDANAFDNLPRRMATSGLIGGAMGAGLGGFTPGGFGRSVQADPTTPPTDRMGGRGPTKSDEVRQGPTNPTSPETAGPTPDTTALDEAAAQAESRLNEQFNRAAPVGTPSPADQSASSQTEQGTGADPTASVLRDLGIEPADFAARVEQARVDQYRSNPQQAYLDGKITREQLVAFLDERVANNPGEQLRRQAEARATGPQPEMRRVDRNPRAAVTLNPNAQQQDAQQRRVPDRLDIEGKARKITEAVGKGWILDRRFGLMDTRQQEDMIRAGERLDPIWGETIRPEADPATMERLGIARPQQTQAAPTQQAPQGRAGTLADLLGMDSEADAQRYANTLSPSERERLGLPQRAPEVQRQAQGIESPTTVRHPQSSPAAPATQTGLGSSQTSTESGIGGNRPPASPQSTREPWQMTRGEWVGGGTVGRIRFGDVDREFVESPQFDTPEEAKAWASSRGIANPQIQSSGKRGGPKLYKASGSTSVHRDAVESAHAAGKPVPPEVLAEYGIKPNPSVSPNSSNPPAKPDGSTQPQGDAAATTNQEPTNGEEEAAQAEVLTDGAPAPAKGAGSAAPAKVEGKGNAVEAKTEPAKAPKKAKAASATPDKKIGDAGDKIGGARKDVWAKRGLTVADIEKMNEREAFKHTNKDAAWPKPDYEAMVAAGVEPSAARLLKTIRDRIAATPKDTHDDRVRFLQGMAVIRPLWEAAKTVADVNALANNVMTAFGFQKSATDKDLIPGWRNTPEAKQYFALFKDRKSPFELRYIDARRAAREIAAGWPSKKGEGAEWFDIRKKSDGAYLLFKKSNPYQPIVRDVFTSEDAARAYAAEHFDKGGRQKTNGPQRPTVEGVTRAGPDYRKGRDIDSNEFREAFGFRGVEFGNWMTQADRQQTMNHAYDGLMDLATAMGIPPLAVSLNGHLAAAFGARGLGGQGAAAHYEPTRRVFNLTKLSGQGSLAHEWGHAFDDYLGTMTGVATNSVPFATDLRKKTNNTLRPEVLSALRNAMDVIRSIPATAEQEIGDHTDNLAKSRKQLGLWFDSWKRAFTQGRNVRSKKIEPTAAQIQKFSDILDSAREAAVPGDAINEAAELWGSVYGVKVDKETADALRHYAENIPRRSKIIADLASGAKAPSTIRDTNVLAASKEADTKRSSPYYATDTELFARMFEMWVYDRLAADAGKKNVGVSQYLVNNISEAEAASPMYWQGVHAFGTERTAIGKAMGELVASLRVQDTVDGEVMADAPVKTNASASERAMSTLERIAADAAARMEARAKKRGARLYSTIIPIMHPLDIIDTSAWVAAHALRATIKGGRALTAFIDAKLAERFPGVQYDKRAVRKTVAAYLKNATTEQEIYDAWKTANSRESKRRIAAVAGESPDPKAVKEAAATGAAERPDVAAKIIDAVRRGLRQGRAEGLRTASDAIKPLIRQARDAAKRARQVADIEARGASEKATNAAKDQAATEKGIRAEAVRLVQETPIAGRGKYLRAVAGAKDMRDLAKILRRLRGDLAKETGRHFALRAERLEDSFKKLDEKRLNPARKLLRDIRQMYAELKDKDTGVDQREELADSIRDSFETLNSIIHEQRAADKVFMQGRAIVLAEHRDQMMQAVQKQAELPKPENSKDDREPTWLRQKIRKYADFRTLMQILDRVWDETGIFSRARRAMESRRTAELAKNHEFIDKAEKIVQANGYKSWSDFMARSEGAMGDSGVEVVKIDLGAVDRLTVGQAMALYAQDIETKELMHAGQPWRLNRSGDSFVIDDYKLAELESKLTAGQKRIARQINQLRSEMQFDRADAVYKRITGNHMTRVDGHYPRKRILDKSGSEDTIDIAKLSMGEWAVQSLENSGFTIKRVQDKKTPLLLEDFGSTQVRSFQGTEMMIQRAEMVKYLKATLFNPAISDAIAQRYGGAMMKRITQVVAEYSGNSAPESDKFIRKVAAGTARSMTQVNPGTWLRNLSTVFRLPLAMIDGKMVGAGAVAAAIPKALLNWRSTLKILMQHSPDLRHRWSHAGAAISMMPTGATTDVDSHFADATKATVRQVLHAARAWNSPRTAGGRLRQVGKGWGQILDSIKVGNAFDAFAAVVAYHIARAKAPESLSPNAGDKWAARKAADAFMQTANTNDLLNANEWQTDAKRNTGAALILTFTSDIAKMQNLLFLANKRGGKARTLAAGAVAASLVWSVAVRYALASLLGDDDEKKDQEAINTVREELVSLIPGGTNLWNPLLDTMTRGGRTRLSVLDTPLTSIVRHGEALVNEMRKEDGDPLEMAYRASRVFLDPVGNPLAPISGMARRAFKNYAE